MVKRLLSFCLIGACVAHAATYYVNTSTGSDSNTTTQAQSTGTPWKTIQHCASTMASGDTCQVFAGTYSENVNLSAGASGLYKTLTVNPGATVNVLSFTVNSHDKVDGFHIQNPSSPSSAACVTFPSSSTITDVYVTNNTMYACNQFLNVPTSSTVSFLYLLSNTMSYSCSTSAAPNVCRAMTLIGDHVLIDGNDISHVSDGPYTFGHYIVFRNNKFHDVPQTDCGSNSSNCHIDFSQADANSPYLAEYLLFEGNSSYNMSGSDEHAGPLLQANTCGGHCFNAIFRFHKAYHVTGGAITDDNSLNTPSAPNSPAWINVKAYNNSWVDLLSGSLSGIVNPHSHGSSGGSNLNEIYYFVGTSSGATPYNCGDTACTGTPTTTPPGNAYVYGHSLAFATGGGTIASHTGSGSFTADPGNVIGDPLFVDYSGNDFHLQSGSPARNAGTSLTTVTASAGTCTAGSSTTLVVGDASFFQDGYGIAGVQPDTLRVGASTTVQIASGGVSYGTNTLTLASPITCTAGNGVYIYKISDGTQVLFGANPDMGALPYGTTSPSVSPTSLGPWTNTQVVSTSLAASNFAGTVTWSKLSGAQPTGLSGTCLTGTTGGSCTLTGTLSAAGSFTFTVRATDGTSTVDTPFTVTVNAAPSITTASGSLPDGQVNIAYSDTLGTAGGTGALTCAATGLPTGVSFTGCQLQGTPTNAGSYSFTAIPTDANGVSGSGVSLSINVLSPDTTTPVVLHSSFCGPGLSFPRSCGIVATTAGTRVFVAYDSYNSAGGTCTSGSANNCRMAIVAIAGGTCTELTPGAPYVNTSGGNNSWNDWWMCVNGTAGTTSVSITPGTSQLGNAFLWEVQYGSGVSCSAASSQASTTTPVSPTLAVATKTLLLAALHPGAIEGGSPTGIHSGNPFTTDSISDDMGWAHYTSSSPGSYFAEWDITPTATYASGVCAIQALSSISGANLSISGTLANGLIVP